MYSKGYALSEEIQTRDLNHPFATYKMGDHEEDITFFLTFKIFVIEKEPY